MNLIFSYGKSKHPHYYATNNAQNHTHKTHDTALYPNALQDVYSPYNKKQGSSNNISPPLFNRCQLPPRMSCGTQAAHLPGGGRLLRHHQAPIPPVEAGEAAQGGPGRPARRHRSPHNDADDQHRAQHLPLRLVCLRPLLGL